MQAIILAGGFGTRLKTITGDALPKPMVPIGNEPFLATLLKALARQGIDEAVLAVHHGAEVIRAYFGSHFAGIMLHYTEEPAPLGTGGAIRLSLAALKPQGPVLVLNGDTFAEIDIATMTAAHQAAHTLLTVALIAAPDCGRFGEAVVDAHGRITEFLYPGRAQAGRISAGWYIVHPQLFHDYILPEAFSFEADFKRPHCMTLKPLAWREVQYFIDIGTPEDYLRACMELPAHFKQPA